MQSAKTVMGKRQDFKQDFKELSSYKAQKRAFEIEKIPPTLTLATPIKPNVYFNTYPITLTSKALC